MSRLLRTLLLLALASLGLAPCAHATTYTFVGAVPGHEIEWFQPQNWSPVGVPGAADTAVINKSTPGGITVQFGGTVTVAGLTISNVDSTIDGGDINNPANNGTLNVTSAFNWSGGTIRDAAFNVATGAQLNISGSAAKTIGDNAALNNAGAATWTGTGSIVMFEEAAGSALNNSGTFNIQTDAPLDNPRFQFGVCKVTNSGTLTKVSGAGVSRFNHVRFTSSGNVNVNSGTLEPAGIVTLSGPINVAANCFYNLARGTDRFNTGTSFNGAGLVRLFDASDTTNANSSSIDVSGVAIVNSTFEMPATVTGSDGLYIRSTGDTLTLGGTGNFNWKAGNIILGTLALNSGLHWNISGSATKSFSQIVINNAATATWTGAGNISPGGTLNNSGTFNVQTDADIGGFNTQTTFNNSGTLTKSASSGVTEFSTGGVNTFNNSGTVNVNSGTLKLGVGGGTMSGPFNMAAGAVLEFDSTNKDYPFVFNTGTMFSGAGKVLVDAGGVVMRGAAPANCTFEIAAGNLQDQSSTTTLSLSGSGPINWTSGEINGVLNIAAGTPFNISGSADKTLGCVFNNAGAATWSGTGRIIGASGTVNNTGSFTATNNVEFGGVFSAATFNNSGTLTKSTGTGTTSFGNSQSAINFNNSGTVNTLTGTLDFENTFTQTAGATLLNGGSLNVANPLKLQGGVLYGNGTVTGNIANSGGQVSPGVLAPGTLNETGDYTQSATGSLRIQLNGATPGTQYDRLNVTGAVALGGPLVASAGFAPAAGTAFSIINNDGADAVVGTFAGLPQGASVMTSNGAYLRISYTGGDGNDVVLTSFKPSLSINDAPSVIEGNSGTKTETFTVTLSDALNQTVTVDYATANGTAVASTATTPGNYLSRSGTLTFSAGQTSKTIVVTINGDTLDENDETFFVDLKNPTTGIALADSHGIGTILDDDPPPTLSISDAAPVIEGNPPASTPATFNVTLSAPSGKVVTVQYATAPGTADTTDYTITTGTLTFNPGETTKPIMVPIIGDLLDEADETFSVNLSNPVNATIADGTGTGTILDDDGPTIIISNPAPVTEGVGVSAVFTVSLSAPSLQTVTVHYTTADFTATAGTDYAVRAGTLSFAPGETSKTISVPIIDDALAESTETFLMTLSSPTNGVIADGTGAVFILDNDGGHAAKAADEEPSS